MTLPLPPTGKIVGVLVFASDAPYAPQLQALNQEQANRLTPLRDAEEQFEAGPLSQKLRNLRSRLEAARNELAEVGRKSKSLQNQIHAALNDGEDVDALERERRSVMANEEIIKDRIDSLKKLLRDAESEYGRQRLKLQSECRQAICETMDADMESLREKLNQCHEDILPQLARLMAVRQMLASPPDPERHATYLGARFAVHEKV